MPEKTTPEKVEAPNKDKLRQLADEKRRIAAKKRRRKKIVKWSILTVLLLAIAGGIAYGVLKRKFPTRQLFPIGGLSSLRYPVTAR